MGFLASAAARLRSRVVQVGSKVPRRKAQVPGPTKGSEDSPREGDGSSYPESTRFPPQGGRQALNGFPGRRREASAQVPRGCRIVPQGHPVIPRVSLVPARTTNVARGTSQGHRPQGRLLAEFRSCLPVDGTAGAEAPVGRSADDHWSSPGQGIVGIRPSLVGCGVSQSIRISVSP